jgi:hypothetical protein
MRRNAFMKRELDAGLAGLCTLIKPLFKSQSLLSACLMPVFFMTYYPSTLKISGMCSSEMSVEIRQSSRRYIPWDSTDLAALYPGTQNRNSACVL